MLVRSDRNDDYVLDDISLGRDEGEDNRLVEKNMTAVLGVAQDHHYNYNLHMSAFPPAPHGHSR
jgi:hypothetical protein